MALTMAYAELGLCVGRTQCGEGGGDGDRHRPRRWRGAPVTASSCDAATGPNARRSRTASDAPRSAPCGAAPPPSASCAGNTGPRSTSRPSAASSKPNAARARPTSPTHRRRRARQTHDRLSEAATRTGIAHEHANDDLQISGTPPPRITRRAHTAARRRHATRHARHRSALRLLVYENAARAVGLDLSRRLSKAPYSPSLEQLVAEADRQVARESRKPDRHQSRPEAAPMTPTRPAVRPARPHPATDAPSTGYAVDSSGTWSPPARGGHHPRPSPFDAHSLADTLAQASPAVEPHAEQPASPARRRPRDRRCGASRPAGPAPSPRRRARAAVERRHHHCAFRAAIGTEAATGASSSARRRRARRPRDQLRTPWTRRTRPDETSHRGDHNY